MVRRNLRKVAGIAAINVLRKSVCYLLIAVTLLTLPGCFNAQPTDTTSTFPTETPIPIDWTLYGTYLSGTGTALRTLEFSMHGTVTLGKDGCDTLELDIDLPESFGYQYIGPTVYPSQSRKYFPELPYCVCPTYSFVPSRHDSIFSVFALSLEQEFAIFNWSDGSDYFLVAATDPDTDPQEILAFFDGFAEEYEIDD